MDAPAIGICRVWFPSLFLALILFLGACGPRPAEWAQPVPLEGVPNLYQVADNLYRSAQPTAAGMKHLEKNGIRTIINLRALHNDREMLKGTALLNEELSVKTWHIEDEDVVRVLRIVKDPAGGPYLIHCEHGADRTGTMVAMYRMVVQGWPRQKAIFELVTGGYGFHPFWLNILVYLERVDIGKIREAVQE